MDILYYVAASLDGYIATSDGGVDWLSIVEATDEDYGYADFYETVDGLVMGSRTYEQILTFGEWPYPGKPCWVASRRTLDAARPEVTVTEKEPRELVSEIAGRGLRRIWLVGGGTLAASFRVEGLITEYIISMVPILLGSGIPLFDAGGPKEQLQLAKSTSYPSGLVQLRYTQKTSPENS